jgi:hypothetical protein
MTELLEVDTDGQSKCPMCGFRFSTLYRLEDEKEEHAACGDCTLQYFLEKNIRIAREGEIAIDEDVLEQIKHALAELSAGELDELEDTLRSINNQLPEDATTTAPTV